LAPLAASISVKRWSFWQKFCDFY